MTAPTLHLLCCSRQSKENIRGEAAAVSLNRPKGKVHTLEHVTPIFSNKIKPLPPVLLIPPLGVVVGTLHMAALFIHSFL